MLANSGCLFQCVIQQLKPQRLISELAGDTVRLRRKICVLSSQDLCKLNHNKLLLQQRSTHSSTTWKNHDKLTDVAPSSDREAAPRVPKRGAEKLWSIMKLMRWDKPTGTVLALTPSLWAVSLVTPETSLMPSLETVAIFTAGAIVARGMGCTINDILDRKYDRLVERTKWRPIACGDISATEGLVYLGVQSLVGLYVLCLNNLAVIKLGLFSGLMISSYPLFKRFTYWPQIMLALTMNWGVLMGYAAVRGSIGMEDVPTLLPIYMGSILWTLYYDTIYAHQDKTDDMFIGVKSSALVLGDNTKKFLYQMSGGMMLSLSIAGALTQQLWPFYMTVITSNLFQTYQVRTLDLDNKEDCWRAFDSQKYIGFFILAGVLSSVAMKHRRNQEESTRLANSANVGCPVGV